MNTMVTARDEMDPRGWSNYSGMGGPLDFGGHAEESIVCSLRNNHAWTLDVLQVPFPVQLKQLIKGLPVA